MKKHLRLPTQRTRLKLSAGFCALALLFLWLTADAPMPLPILSHYKAAAECGVDLGGVVAGGTVRFQSGAKNTKGDTDQGLRWRVSRCGDGYFVTTHRRVGGLFWDGDVEYPLRLDEGESSAETMLARGFNIVQTGPFSNGMRTRWQQEIVSLLYVAVPDVVRVEVFQDWYDPDDSAGLSEYDWLLTHGASTDCTEVAPGTGLWLAQQIWPSSGGGGATLIRAYGADGELLYESPVPGGPGFDG